MEFRVLGPLEVVEDGRSLPLGGHKQRTLLATLLIHANEVVPTDTLMDAIWGEAPPTGAANTLQVYVSKLRRSLAAGGRTGETVLVSRRPGYLLRVHPDEVDMKRFERLVEEAREDRLRGTPERSATKLREALRLWRGPAFADFSYEPFAQPTIRRLEELRASALEDRVEADLALGRHGELAPELQELVAAHPLRERLRGHLMLALYRSGRQAEALEAYEKSRKILRDELGIDPPRELQELHERILRRDPALVLKGEPLRGYRLLEQVGEGAFGVVYRAIQPHVEREVAIKAMPPELANHPDFVRRFEREAQIVARLEHPHIVPLYDYWREPDAAYLVMRFLRGGSLEDLLRSGPLAPARAAQILDQVAAALSAAHRQGVVHRDVKPGNVLLDEEGNAYLSDFGVALDAGSPEERLTGTMTRTTPAYLSPEQIRLEPATPRSDTYALGIVAFEMLTGAHPFPETSPTALLARHAHDPLPSVRNARPELAPAVDEAIGRATAKDRADRFAEVLDFAVAFRAALEGSYPVRVPIAEIRNPYKGLRAFLEADAEDFFGRETLVERLVGRLAEADPAARFLAVVGPSGSGKSSVVRAGLVPALRRAALPGSELWYVIDVLPGAHPLRELESALLGIAVEPLPSLMEELERDELGLVRAVDRVLPHPEAELVILLDQLEEVFTLVQRENERAHVLAILQPAVLESDTRIRIVTTLRADFFDAPLSVRGFGDLLAARHEAVTPMAPEELERAIVAPADRVGLVVEPMLLAAMIADVADRPGTLPLLQYALTELTDRATDGVLSIEAYRRIGGVSGALARRAQQLFKAMNGPAREACRQLFLRLVTLGEVSEDTRRRVLRSEVGPIADAEVMDGVIDAFDRHRLLSFDRDPATREPTIEIAHEALLGAWTRLRGWIDEARDDIRTQRRLSSAASEWVAANRDDSFLLRGARLERTASWAQTTSVALSDDDKAYLRASIARREAEDAAEDARKEREAALERRSVMRLRAMVAVFAVAALVAASLTLVAKSQGDRAERESRVARARELAAAAVASLDDDAERSVLLAIEAVETTREADGTVLPEAEEALHQAIQADRLIRTFPGAGSTVRLSPDGSRLLTPGTEPGTAHVYDIETGRELLTITGHGDETLGARYSPDGDYISTDSISGGGSIKIWDAHSGEELFTFADPSGDIVCCWNEFSPDRRVLATQVSDASRQHWSTRFYSLETGKELRRLRLGFTGPVGFAPDGERLALGECVVEWRKPDDEPVCGTTHGDVASDVSWSADGSRFATSFWGGPVTIWDPRSGDEVLTLVQGVPGSAADIEFSPIGSRLAMGFTDGSVRVWNLSGAGATEALVLPGHDAGLSSMKFSADGTRLATAAPGFVNVWDVGPEGGTEWLTVRGSGGFAYSPDGTRVAIGDDDTVRIYEADTGRLLRTFDGRQNVLAAAFAPDGRRVAAGTSGGMILVWDIESGDRLLRLERPGGGVLDVAFSPDGRLLATTSYRRTTEIWDASSGGRVHSFDGGGLSLAFSPDGTRLAGMSEVSEQMRPVFIWDVESGLTLHVLRDRSTWFNSVAFAPDGDRVVAGGLDGRVRMWDARSGRPVGTMTGNLSQIKDVAFSPDGTLLATSSDDGTVRLWDPSERRELLTVAHTDSGGSWFEVGFNPDGTRLAATAADGTLHVFVLPIEELLQIAKSRVSRGFTPQECRQYLHLSACPGSS